MAEHDRHPGFVPRHTWSSGRRSRCHQSGLGPSSAGVEIVRSDRRKARFYSGFASQTKKGDPTHYRNRARGSPLADDNPDRTYVILGSSHTTRPLRCGATAPTAAAICQAIDKSLQGILVDLPVLHDHNEILLRVGDQVDVGDRVTVDQ